MGCGGQIVRLLWRKLDAGKHVRSSAGTAGLLRDQWTWQVGTRVA